MMSVVTGTATLRWRLLPPYAVKSNSRESFRVFAWREQKQQTNTRDAKQTIARRFPSRLAASADPQQTITATAEGDIIILFRPPIAQWVSDWSQEFSHSPRLIDSQSPPIPRPNALVMLLMIHCRHRHQTLLHSPDELIPTSSSPPNGSDKTPE